MPDNMDNVRLDTRIGDSYLQKKHKKTNQHYYLFCLSSHYILLWFYLVPSKRWGL